MLDAENMTFTLLFFPKLEDSTVAQSEVPVTVTMQVNLEQFLMSHVQATATLSLQEGTFLVAGIHTRRGVKIPALTCF